MYRSWSKTLIFLRGLDKFLYSFVYIYICIYVYYLFVFEQVYLYEFVDLLKPCLHTRAIFLIVRSSHQRCSVRTKFGKIHRKTPEAWNFIKKEILAQVFSSKYCEISKNTFFYRTPLGDCF